MSMGLNQFQRVKHLLQKHDLHVEYQHILQRYVVSLKDADGKELWHRRHFDANLICGEMWRYLEQFDKEQQTGASDQRSAHEPGKGAVDVNTVPCLSHKTTNLNNR